ncbi:MAG: HEPN domain-containing protein [bacterium]|nr:HEPN domain-containing protein [bacterium]
MDQTVRDMIIGQMNKAAEKLAAAKSLAKEGFFDDAISRAYYAVFHAASAVLLTEGITVNTRHSLKSMFGLHLVKSGKLDTHFGKVLNKIKDERENGDYDIFTFFEDEDAEEDIKEAEQFLKGMKEYLEDSYGIKEEDI